MIANYHTHTPRCNHAKGTEEEYVQAALKRGSKILGFSDHTPYFFPDGYYSNFRMRPHQLQDYTDSVLAVRGKYADQIDIHCGLEAEYYPKYFPELLAFLRNSPVEYLILGQHFVDNEINSAYSGSLTDDEEVLKRYCYQVMDAMNTGLFSYFAHPDILHFAGDLKKFEKYMRLVCKEAKSCHIPLEINLLGLRDSRHYPNGSFWRIAAEEGCLAIIGSDAHSPQALLDYADEEKAIELAKRYEIDIIQRLDLRHI